MSQVTQTITLVGPRAAPSKPRLLLALTKPRIGALSVATAAVGLSQAPEHVTTGVVLALLVGTGLIVGSANALNMYLEREIDGKMTRTRLRPLPSGRLCPRAALRFGVSLGALALPLLWWGTRPLTAALAALALFLYVLVYTPMKRRSIHALLVGAIPGAMPPLLGYTAATGRLSLGGLLLFGVVFVWQIPHFLAISLFRRDDYRASGLKVMPNECGERVTRITIASALVLQLLLSLALAPPGRGGLTYLVGAGALGALQLGFAVYGLVSAGGDAWARRLFAASIVFLPLLFALLIVASRE